MFNISSIFLNKEGGTFDYEYYLNTRIPTTPKGNTVMNKHYPEQIRALPRFEGPFDAYKLAARNCDVLFASYPPGTVIDTHKHETDNVGVITQGELVLTMDGKTDRISVGDWYHVPANKEHSAKFDVETSEIEFWFDQSNT